MGFALVHAEVEDGRDMRRHRRGLELGPAFLRIRVHGHGNVSIHAPGHGHVQRHMDSFRIMDVISCLRPRLRPGPTA